MSVLNGYEVGTPVSERPHGGLWEARSLADPAGRYVLKRFRPAPSRNVRRVLELEAWLCSVERQQSLAAAGGPAVPVLTFGSDVEGGYAVLKRCDLSLEFVLGSVKPSSAMLRVIVPAVVRALEEWEAAWGGPHGNLTSGNVFFSGVGPLAERKVLLSDPAWTLGTSAAALRKRQRLQLGTALVRFVRGLDATGWPVENDPKWQALGRSGFAWREFCNVLLDPNRSDETSSLSEFLDIARRVPKERNPTALAALSLGGVVGAGALALTAYARFGDTESMPDRILRLAEVVGNPRAVRAEVTPEWSHLAEAWATWLGELSGRWPELSKRPELWGADDALRKELEGLVEDRARTDPRTFGDFSRLSYNDLATRPPAEARTERVLRQARNALERVDRISKALSDWSQWDAWKVTADEFAARKWTGSADELRKISPVSRTPKEATRTLLSALTSGRDAVVLARSWAHWKEATAASISEGDPVLAGIPDMEIAALHDDDLLADPRGVFDEALVRLRTYTAWWKSAELDKDAYRRDSAFARWKEPVTQDTLVAWEQELLLFSKLPEKEDPRASAPWSTQYDTVGRKGREIDEEEESSAGDEGQVTRKLFESEFAALAGKVQALQALRPLRRDAALVKTSVEGLSASLTALEARVDRTIESQRPERWLARVEARTWALESSKSVWDIWRTRALGSNAAARFSSDKALFRRTQAQERVVRAWLAAYEGPDGMGGLAVPALDGVSTAVASDFKTLAVQRRSVVSNDLIQLGGWGAEGPSRDWASLAGDPAVRQRLAREREWFATVSKAASMMDRLGAFFDEGFGWSEGVEELVSDLEKLDGIAALGGTSAARLREGVALRGLALSTDRAELTAGLALPGLSARLTSWRRLGTLADWPATSAEFDVETGAREALLKSVGSLADVRRQLLAAEFTAEAKSRWSRAAYAAVGRDDASVDKVFSALERYNLTEAGLDPVLAYDYRLWQFKSKEVAKLKLDDLRAKRDAFASSVQAQPAVSTLPEIMSFLESLKKLGLVEDRGDVVTPQNAGWVEELGADGEEMNATWSQGGKTVKISYVRVLPNDGTAPFFLAKRAVSIGDFVTLMNARPAAAEVLAAMPARVKQGTDNAPFDAPMGWTTGNKGTLVARSPQWIANPKPGLYVHKKADGGLDILSGTASTEIPSDRMPLQQLPPEAAKLVAERLMGARLPKLSEWTALMAEMGSVELPKNLNLRDKTFADNWKQSADPKWELAWRPDEGRFPWPVGPENKDAAWAGRDDGALWFAPVEGENAPMIEGFAHLFGNVAIFIYNEKDRQYYVGGGSSLSPADLDPKKTFIVPSRKLIGGGADAAKVGYSDVGLRPACDVSKGLRDRYDLLQLLRKQKYLSRR